MPRTIANVDWPVHTERLSLRPVELRDATATFAYRRLPDVSMWMTTQITDLEVWRTELGRRLGTTLVIEKDGVVIGDLMLMVQDPWSQAEIRERAAGTLVEIGYVLDPAHAGQGYATEAVREELRICFEVLGVRRVTAQCFADNEASWRLMERVGMRREQHTKQDSLHRSGQWLDGMMYALLADEWRAQQAAGPVSRP